MFLNKHKNSKNGRPFSGIFIENVSIRFAKVALSGFGQNRSMFLIVVFLIKKPVYTAFKQRYTLFLKKKGYSKYTVFT